MGCIGIIWDEFGVRLGTSRTDSNCHGDICPGNICSGDICTYQKYLSSDLPDFDETLKIGSWEHLEKDSNCHGDICPAVTDKIWTKL